MLADDIDVKEQLLEDASIFTASGDIDVSVPREMQQISRQDRFL